MRFFKRRFVINSLKILGFTGVAAGGAFIFYNDIFSKKGALDRKKILDLNKSELNKQYIIPSRAQLKQRLKKEKEYDIIIIGGGATGLGTALDAVSRGLKTALFEYRDFASCTSSRSTKMAHGGVRYLEKAVKKLSWSEFQFVYEGLKERKHFFNVAPHLTQPLRLLTPCLSFFESLQMYIGLRLYDILSTPKYQIGPSSWFSKKKTLSLIPSLNEKKLWGSMAYYDAVFTDQRMAIAIAQTAAVKGGTILNHTKVVDFIKNPDTQQIIGVKVQDELTHEVSDVYGKVVINATGAYSDRLRKMDDNKAQSVISGSSGVHIVIDKNIIKSGDGILIPKTQDGRVLFLVPYHGKCVAGTTDEKTTLETGFYPSEKHIQFIINNLQQYFKSNITRKNVLSAWSGIRPLAAQTGNNSTASLSRDLSIEVSKNNLLSITGGKWTSYRKMGELVVDSAIKHGKLFPKFPKSQSFKAILVGSTFYDRTNIFDLLKQFKLQRDVKNHLVNYYGDRSIQIASLAQDIVNGNERLLDSYPHIKAEVVYSIKNEYVEKITDLLCHRLNFMILDKTNCIKLIPEISKLLAQERNLSKFQQQQQEKEAYEYINKRTQGQITTLKN